MPSSAATCSLTREPGPGENANHLAISIPIRLGAPWPGFKLNGGVLAARTWPQASWGIAQGGFVNRLDYPPKPRFALAVKQALLHEEHNRQDKAHKADYRDEMRPRRYGTWSGMSTGRATGGKYVITVQLTFAEVKPLVATALRTLEPNIDLKKLTNALRSAIGNHRSTFYRATPKLAPSVVASEAQRISANSCKTLPGRFLRWHDSVPDDASGTPPAIPAEFHLWLQKMVLKPNSATTNPAVSAAPPPATSSPPNTAAH